jgi:hypothetical protein
VAHLDEETLVLVALGEASGDAEAHAGHLDVCDTCRSEVAALRRVAVIGAETQEVRELHPPPNDVWARIAAATNVDEPEPSTVDDDAGGPAAPPERQRRSGARTASPNRSDRTTGPQAARGPGRMRRWAMTAAAVVAALGLGVSGTLVATREPDSVAVECGAVVARADLSALPLAPRGATGEARVLCSGPDRRLHLHVDGLALQPGYYEVWLIDPDSMEMTAIGQLGDGGDVLLPLSSTTDLRKYRLVDISAEQYDNNQAHSGQSLLRGQLTT